MRLFSIAAATFVAVLCTANPVASTEFDFSKRDCSATRTFLQIVVITDLETPVSITRARVGAELVKRECRGGPGERSNMVVWKPNLVAISI
ncbi:hypothetical protein K432DRAFT_411045 [Lepidopterella palustris CBS 459.81]|uniref:Uncharacterized protein n=1 Tax=Lepidopterella palustris CBS 459.81 TaxID=1314670 RepID=A0A8E2DWK8_9PEZI|nr:hypothetical protein K432DRAFT_411045 [Lepidopterella palustris CBS 459.81]